MGSLGEVDVLVLKDEWSLTLCFLSAFLEASLWAEDFLVFFTAFPVIRLIYLNNAGLENDYKIISRAPNSYLGFEWLNLTFN